MYPATTFSSPLGTLTIASDDQGEHLVGLWMEGQKYHGATIHEHLYENNSVALFDKTKEWINRYFRNEKPAISELPLAPIGSEFRQNVWKILCDIPYGKVITYKDIAKIMAKKTGKEKMSSQAVGGAVGHNPISIIIPCHRVVGSNGSLTGYAGGIQIKEKLLELEGVDMQGLSKPTEATARAL